MNAEVQWWLLILGIVIGGALVYLVMADLRSAQDDGRSGERLGDEDDDEENEDDYEDDYDDEEDDEGDDDEPVSDDADSFGAEPERPDDGDDQVDRRTSS